MAGIGRASRNQRWMGFPTLDDKSVPRSANILMDASRRGSSYGHDGKWSLRAVEIRCHVISDGLQVGMVGHACRDQVGGQLFVDPVP